MRQLIHRIRAFFAARTLDADFDQELEAHLDQLAEDYQRRGLSREEAVRAARIHFGGAAQLREAHRAARGLPVLDALLKDVRYAVRALRKNPGFTALAVVTLAIGIGVNTAAFTAYNAAVLQPLRAKDPERLMQIARATRDASFSYPQFAFFRDHSRSFTSLVAMATGMLSMSGVAPAPAADAGLAGAAGLRFPHVIGSSEPVTATVVSGNYFETLGVSAASPGVSARRRHFGFAAGSNAERELLGSPFFARCRNPGPDPDVERHGGHGRGHCAARFRRHLADCPRSVDAA